MTMSATQSTEAIGTPEVGTTAPATQSSLLQRWFDAIVESRIRKAQRQIGEHLRFVPDEVLRRAGYRRHEQG